MMEKAEDIDEMSTVHAKFVTRLQERTILSKDLKPIHKAIIEILDLCVQFVEAIDRTNGTEISVDKKKTKRVKKRSESEEFQLEQRDSASDMESVDGEAQAAAKDSSVSKSPRETLLVIDKEFTRLMPFITAGLKGIGRVGAEPILGQLAERLEWDGMSAGVERFS